MGTALPSGFSDSKSGCINKLGFNGNISGGIAHILGMTIQRSEGPVLCSGASAHRWGIILAGGDGKRLLPLTRKISGDDRPKQFCALTGSETLLKQTQRRVGQMILGQQTLLVMTRTHERYYSG